MNKSILDGMNRFFSAFKDQSSFCKAFEETMSAYSSLPMTAFPIWEAEDYFSHFPFEEIAVMLKLFQHCGVTHYPNMLAAQLGHENLVDGADNWCMATEPWEERALAFCYFTLDFTVGDMRKAIETGSLPRFGKGKVEDSSAAYVACWEGWDEVTRQRFLAILWEWFRASTMLVFMTYEERMSSGKEEGA